MVTRTFTITHAVIYVADFETGTIVSVNADYAGSLTPEQVMKLERKHGNDKCVKVEIIATETQLRGMTEDEFIAGSKIIRVGGKN